MKIRQIEWYFDGMGTHYSSNIPYIQIAIKQLFHDGACCNCFELKIGNIKNYYRDLKSTQSIAQELYEDIIKLGVIEE